MIIINIISVLYCNKAIIIIEEGKQSTEVSEEHE